MDKKSIIHMQDIEKAYIMMARIVRDYGDKYMPVFQRMHDIRNTYKAKQDLKNIALQIAHKTLE